MFIKDEWVWMGVSRVFNSYLLKWNKIKHTHKMLWIKREKNCVCLFVWIAETIFTQFSQNVEFWANKETENYFSIHCEHMELICSLINMESEAGTQKYTQHYLNGWNMLKRKPSGNNNVSHSAM